jgi:hypothetical protein
MPKVRRRNDKRQNESVLLLVVLIANEMAIRIFEKIKDEEFINE